MKIIFHPQQIKQKKLLLRRFLMLTLLVSTLTIATTQLYVFADTDTTSNSATYVKNDKNKKQVQRTISQSTINEPSIPFVASSSSTKTNTSITTETTTPLVNSSTNQSNSTNSLRDLLFYFFGSSPIATTSTSTPIEPTKDTSTSIPSSPTKKTPLPSSQATSTAGTIDDITTPPDESSDYINPLLTFGQQDASTYNAYLYAGLGSTTTLFLLLTALILGIFGFTLVVQDTLLPSHFNNPLITNKNQKTFKEKIIKLVPNP